MRPLRVSLINLPTITAPHSFSYYGAVPPLGLAYVAASVRAAGHDLTVIDATGEALDARVRRPSAAGVLELQGLTVQQIVRRVPRDTEVVGVSHMFLHQWPLLRELADALREALPACRLVAGGENATAFWETILADCPAIDVCVMGEGERTFTALLAAMAGGEPLEGVPGLALRVGGRGVKTAAAARIELIDELPDPAWDLFPVAAYLDRGHSGGVSRGRSMPLLTSRGCPYRCSFCSSPEMWTTRYVRRDPERIADEIERYVARYGIDNVDLNDLTAMLTKEWIIAFAQTLVRRGVRVTIQLPSGTRSEAVDSEAAQWLVRAGVRNFCYAPESGAPSTLERIHKNVKLDRLRSSLRAAIDAGLTTHASIIIGFPHESLDELWSTYRFVLRLALDGLDTVAVMIFAPYPGSEEYRRLVAEGKLRHDEAYFFSSLLRSAGARAEVHPRLSGTQLSAMQLSFLLSFYALAYARRPWRLTGIAARLARGRQETVMDQFLRTKLRQLGFTRAPGTSDA